MNKNRNDYNQTLGTMTENSTEPLTFGSLGKITQGLRVIENEYLPDDMALLVKDGKVLKKVIRIGSTFEKGMRMKIEKDFLKCPKKQKDCKCLSKRIYLDGGYFCVGIVKNPKPEIDVIRLCDGKQGLGFQITPDEALTIGDFLIHAVHEWFKQNTEYDKWRREK